jgi:hypothetical protein
MRAGASGGGWASVTDMADGPFRFGVIGAPGGKGGSLARDDSLKAGRLAGRADLDDGEPMPLTRDGLPTRAAVVSSHRRPEPR